MAKLPATKSTKKPAPKPKPAIKAKSTTLAKVSKKEPPKKEAAATPPTQVPRGQRADFLRIVVTLPAELLGELRVLGMKRKANKQKDTDASSLIREAVTEFLAKHTEN